MITDLVSINVILQEVTRDLGLGDRTVPLSDFKEWIIEGLKHIGVETQNRKLTATVEIEDYIGVLPLDFYQLIGLKDGIQFKFNTALVFDDDADLNERQAIVDDYKVTVKDINIIRKNINASFQTGEVKIHYWAFPLDSEGFLMIPDDVSYKDAMMWKVAYQLSIRGYKFENVQMRDIKFTGHHWRFYVKQARAEGRKPDRLLMERLKNDWLTLVMNPHQFRNDFRFLGDAETLKLDANTSRNY